MEKNRFCRRCLLKEASPEDYQKYVERFIKGADPSAREEEDIYQERLKACLGCEKLSAGTCLACGCYVELRALARSSRCPRKPSRWKR